MSCDSCYSGDCPTCHMHYCCESCPHELGHRCECACKEFEQIAMEA